MFSHSQLYRRTPNGGRIAVSHPQDKISNNIVVAEDEKNDNSPRAISPLKTNDSVTGFVIDTIKSVASHHLASTLSATLPAGIAPLAAVFVPLMLIPAAAAEANQAVETAKLLFAHTDGVPRHSMSTCSDEELWYKLGKGYAKEASCVERGMQVSSTEGGAALQAKIHYTIKEYQFQYVIGTKKDALFSSLCNKPADVGACLEYSIEDASDIPIATSPECIVRVPVSSKNLFTASANKLTEGACKDFTTCVTEKMKSCLNNEVKAAADASDLAESAASKQFWFDVVFNKAIPIAAVVTVAYICHTNKEVIIDFSKKSSNNIKDGSTKLFATLKDNGTLFAIKTKERANQFFASEKNKSTKNDIENPILTYPPTPPAPGCKKNP